MQANTQVNAKKKVNVQWKLSYKQTSKSSHFRENYRFLVHSVKINTTSQRIKSFNVKIKTFIMEINSVHEYQNLFLENVNFPSDTDL